MLVTTTYVTVAAQCNCKPVSQSITLMLLTNYSTVAAQCKPVSQSITLMLLTNYSTVAAQCKPVSQSVLY